MGIVAHPSVPARRWFKFRLASPSWEAVDIHPLSLPTRITVLTSDARPPPQRPSGPGPVNPPGITPGASSATISGQSRFAISAAASTGIISRPGKALNGAGGPANPPGVCEQGLWKARADINLRTCSCACHGHSRGALQRRLMCWHELVGVCYCVGHGLCIVVHFSGNPAVSFTHFSVIVVKSLLLR